MNWDRLTILIPFAIAFVSAAEPKSDVLEVIVVDYAGRAPGMLMEARQQAARLLAGAGIRTSWKACESAAERSGGSECIRVSPLTLVVRILPARQAKIWKISGSTCGVALIGDGTVRARLALIEVDCVERMAHRHSGVVLGHAMAHEVAHLLLGHGRHTASGLMTSRWNTGELAMALRGDLTFSEEDSVQLQQAVQRRALAAAVAGGLAEPANQH
jgi:hypothetical protein